MKNIQVKLTFQADTNAAKQQMASLQQQLSNLAATPIASAGTQKMRNELQQAANKAVELKVALHNATNVDTGKLNLNKFSQQLKQNKMTLTQYAQELAKLGPQGTQAFLQLTNSIRQAETPMVALTGKMKALTTTLMNTLRWQISSSLITGAVSTFTSIIDYSKELNESLNNIRIVTGKNIDQMSKFADEAQKSAKALSATTTEYTNASLIYYQQGLSDKEVKERTDTTIKLANAVGEEAQTVSEWMTAIWNNFDDGSKSMEYYADVLAKLGAATASSADEIAGGLEKFAAVAETTGLSYEYAAAALATITSETRQSEDVVGTALKTIFARIENLKLGETLEDGLNLGQYSAALEKVGVNILDANGNLKEMDTILDNIATQWNTLNNAEQVALAQSVAGIRQYNQFLALMANWDVMEKNVELARDSTGELEKQNLIYSQGIEGTTARVQNTLDEIKNTLLDENDLIPLLEIANGFLGVVNDLLDAFGGLPTILLAVTTILTKMYSTQIAGALVSAGNFMKTAALTVVGQGGNLKNNMMTEATTAGANIAAQGEGYFGLQQSHNVKASFEDQQQLQEMHGKVNSSMEQYVKMLYEAVQYRRELAQQAANEVDKIDSATNNATLNARDKIKGDDRRNQFVEDVEELKDSSARHYLMNDAETKIRTQGSLGEDGRYSTILNNELEDLKAHGNLSAEGQKSLFQERHKSLGNKTISGAMTDLKNTEDEMDSLRSQKAEYDEFGNIEKKGGKLNKKQISRKKELEPLFNKKDQDGLTQYDKKMKGLTATQKKYKDGIQSVIKRQDNYAQKTKDLTTNYGELGEDIAKVTDQVDEHGKGISNLANKQREELEANKNANAEREKAISLGKTSTEKFVEGASAAMQAAMGVNMLTSGFDSLTTAIAEGDASLSTWASSIASVLMGLTMVAPMLGKVTKALKLNVLWENIQIKLEKLKQKTQEHGIAVQAKATAAEEAAGKKSLKTSLMKAYGYVAEWFGKGPWGWIIGGIALAAISALVVGAMVSSKASANANAANAQKTEEDFNATKEEADKNKETLDTYFDALDTYKETGQEKEKLAEAAKEAAAAYGIEGAAVAALSGNYDTLTEKLRNARVAELEKLKKDSDSAISANYYALDEAMYTGKGGYDGSSGRYEAEFNTGGSWDGETIIQNIAEKYAKDPNYSDIIKYDPSTGDVRLELPSRTSDNYIRAYDAISDIIEEAEEAGITSESDIYNEMREWVGKSSEQVEKMRGFKTAGVDAEAGIAIQNAKTSTGKGIDEVSNYEEFQDYKKAVFKGITDPESEEYKARERLLTEEKGLADYVLIDQAVQDQSKAIKANVDAEFTDTEKQFVDSLQNAYINASEEMIRAMASVEVYPGMTFTDFMGQAKSNLVDATQSIKEGAAEAAKKSTLQADTYTRALQANNEALQKNQALANIVTTRAIKMNNSIEKVTKAWNDNVDAILNNSNNLADYSYALGEVSDELKELFGISDKEFNLTDYISQNTELLKSYFSSGDLQDFQEIQKGIGQEFATAKAHMGDFHGLLTELTAEDYEVGENITLSENLKTIINEILSKDKDGGKLALQNFEAILGIDIQIDTATDTVSSISKIDNGELIQGYFDDVKKDAEKRKLKLDDEIERYYTINHILEDIERGLDNIGKAKDRAFGRDKLGYIKEEKKLLDEQISSYDEKIKQIEKNLPKDREAVAKYGFNIDDQGNITNYDDIYEARLNEYNAAMETASKDEQETIKENWKEFKDSLKQYEETIEEYENTRDAKTEAEYERISKNLEEIRYEVELTTSVSERSLEDIDHQLNTIEDDAFKAAEAIALMGKKAEIAKNNSEANTKGIEKILDTKGISKDELINIAQNTNLSEEEKQQQLFALFGKKQLNEEETEELQNYVNGLWESNEAIREQYEAIQDQVVSAYEKWNEELGYNIEMLERSQSMLESYRNIIDIVGKDTLGISNEVMDQVGQANVKMAQQSVEMARTRYETLKEAYDKATQEGSGVDEETRRELEATMLDAQQEFMDSWASSLEAAAAEFESSVERIMEAYDSAMGNLSEKSEWFEKQQTLQDFFLKDYEKTYEISKLNRQISQSIDSNDNVAAQRKLRDIQSELLDYQKQGKNMSDYDLQYLQKKYDLTMAQNALEDAQNTKSQARLTRDSSGNFGYVYTANQKNIESAQQQFEDKLYAMEQFLDKSQNDLSKQWFELNQQWADEMAALDKNAQDYEQKAADITAYYTELMSNVSGEMTDMVQYGMEINQEYGTHAAETFRETILGKMYTDYSTFQGLQATATEAMQTSLNNIINKHSEFKTNVETTMDKAGTSVEDFKDDYTTWMEEAEKANAKLVQDIKDTATKMKPAFDAVLDATKVFAGQYAKELKPIEDANTKLATSITKLINAYSILTGDDIQKQVDDAYNATTGQKTTGGNGSGTISGNTGGTNDYSLPQSTFNLTGRMNANKSSMYAGQQFYHVVGDNGQSGYVSIDRLRTTEGKTISEDDIFDYLLTGKDLSISGAQKLLSSSEVNRTNTVYEIEEVQRGTQYDLYKINGKLYKENDINFFGGKGKGDKVSLLNGASPTNFEEIDLSSIKYSSGDNQFSTKPDINTFNKIVGIQEYDIENNKVSKGEYYTAGNETLKQLSQLRIVGKVPGTDIWQLNLGLTKSTDDKPWRYYDSFKGQYQNIGADVLFGEGYTKYLNQTDLSQLLGINYADFGKNKNIRVLPDSGYSFDTGGYTGSWGPEGRMAMLHQKEIVLNAHDTENLLTVVEIVRSITDKLNNNILLASQGLGGLVTAAAVNNNREVLEQNVTIHAEFPNATDHNEIELAFNDLINQASQYVNRR